MNYVYHTKEWGNSQNTDRKKYIQFFVLCKCILTYAINLIKSKLLKKLKLSGGFWAEHMHILCVCTYRRLKRQDYKKKGALRWAGSYSETWRSVSHWKLWLEVTHWNFHLLLQDDISCVLITFFLTGEAICVSIPNILHLDNPREHFTNWLPINYWVTRGINTANSEMRN